MYKNKLRLFPAGSRTAKMRLFPVGKSGLFVVPSENMQCGKMCQRISNIDDGLSVLKAEMSAASVQFDPKWANSARAFQLIFARMWKREPESLETLLLGNSVSWKIIWKYPGKGIQVEHIQKKMFCLYQVILAL